VFFKFISHFFSFEGFHVEGDKLDYMIINFFPDHGKEVLDIEDILVFLFGLHQLIERTVLGTARFLYILHQLNQFKENVENQIFNVLDVLEQSHLDPSFSKVVLVVFALEETQGVQENVL
jgi:hypothetical protein